MINLLDWIVLGGTILFIVIYGLLKNRNQKNLETYLRGDSSMKWFTIGISVMATQASAITFMSTPGEAYENGMKFIQFYFGLPLAMIIISLFFVPVYFRLKVYTAYEFLENRFNLATRQLTAFIFLIQRGLSAGLTIYAPSIVLSTIMGIDLWLMNIVIGVLVTLYTVSGGSKAVSQTQKQQMAVMMGGMVVALIILFQLVGSALPIPTALEMAGDLGKLETITTKFAWSDRYNIWSGLIGGMFVALAYFGTDHSQVARYIGGKSMKEIKMGMMFNGIFKIPMQLLILFTGVMVFMFYLTNSRPVYFNTQEWNKFKTSENALQAQGLEEAYTVFETEKTALMQEIKSEGYGDLQKEKLVALQQQDTAIRNTAARAVKSYNPRAPKDDKDYIFLSFIMGYMPHGVIGLLFAVMLCAAMSSTSSELNALSACTTIDFYKRSIRKKAEEIHYVKTSQWMTILWGILAITGAMVFSLFDNLIQAVNIIGSIFYGTVLGIFLAALFIKKIHSTGVIIGALVAQVSVIVFHLLNQQGVVNFGYLWYNVIGCSIVILLGWIISFLFPRKKTVEV